MKKTFGIVIALLVVLVAARSYFKSRRVASTSVSVSDEYEQQGIPLRKATHRAEPAQTVAGTVAASNPQATANGIVQEHQDPITNAQKVLRKRKVKNSITRTMNKVYDKMGRDKTAELAVMLLLRSINETSKTDVPPNLKALCRTQATCPMPMAEFYDTAFNRLDPKEFGNVKVLLQKTMLDSDMPIGQKQSLLLNELLSPEFRDNNPQSYRTEDHKLHLSQNSMALVLTQEQFFSLKPNPQTAINASLTAIRNTQDKAAQLLLINSLAKNYPQYGAYYTPQLESMGLSGPARAPAQSRR